jgi:hypothetical protein
MLRRALRFVMHLPRLVLVGLVRGYQLVISPFFPSACRYQPTCSAYAVQALRTYGAAKGLVLTLYRLGRCHPWGGSGYDPPRWFGEPPPETCTCATDEKEADETDAVAR